MKTTQKYTQRSWARGSLGAALAILIGAAMPWAGAAQDCDYQTFQAHASSFEFVDPGDFDGCAEWAKVTGTLNGTYTVCWNNADFISSDDIYGDGSTDFEAGKYHSWITTKNGTLEFDERSWYETEFGGEAGGAKIVGGTGAFENAFGAFQFYVAIPNLATGVLPFEGYICTP